MIVKLTQKVSFLILVFLTISKGFSQVEEGCKLSFGTNLGGLVDYGTELPFVDLMHNAREWYTKDIGNPDDPFDSGNASRLTYRDDGYPTHIPQSVEGSLYEQRAVTIWAITTGWPPGKYTVLWEGSGKLEFWGGYENLEETGANRLVFDFLDTDGNVIEMTIAESDIDDPIHNIRVLMPGTEQTYEAEPFYSLWLDKLSIFPSVRFMDWGMTNSWGQEDNWTWDDPTLFSWEDRAQMDHYTWATSKGIPYEMMIKLLNDNDLDGWVCVPHRASDDYIAEMASLFHNQLESERHLSVEYSNEIWNWIFGQTQWLSKYGCDLTGTSWPEGVVPFVQNCLDIWTSVFEDDLHRISRVAGVQISWQDVSNRIVRNLREGSFDAVSPTYYFGITEEGDAALDDLGADARVEDVARYARLGMEETKIWLQTQKEELADPLGLPLVFYEGGQHITPQPFGEEPTYAQALLDIQRDTSMFNMYNEWHEFLETLNDGEEPLQLMNFSFIAERSARYGSWGILETMDQDTLSVPAPKYSAIIRAINACSSMSSSSFAEAQVQDHFVLAPNPASTEVVVSGFGGLGNLLIYDMQGQLVVEHNSTREGNKIDVTGLTDGINLIRFNNGSEAQAQKLIVFRP